MRSATQMPQNDDSSPQAGLVADLLEGVTTFKYQLYDVITAAKEGDLPYRHLGRALQRLQWLNLTAGERRYSLKPVRTRE